MEEEEVVACMCDVVQEVHEVEDFKPNRRESTEKWLTDSGASLHLTNDATYMKNRKNVVVKVCVSNGDTVVAKIRGDIELKIPKGRTMVLQDVFYVPNLHCNLILTNRITSKGGKMT